MAFTIYKVYYYYCCYYKTCLQADEWKVYCAWKIPNIASRKKRLHDTDPAKRYHCTECCCFTVLLQFIMLKIPFKLAIPQRIIGT